MQEPAAKIVVSLSGGMDSVVCAALAVHEVGPDAVAALHISYGQRTEAREQTAFLGICERLGIRRRLVVRTPFFRAIGGSALTDEHIAVPEVDLAPQQAPFDFAQGGLQRHLPAPPEEIGAHIPVTYVPFRNAHFLCAAVSWAEVLGAERIYIGAVEQDSSGYPDCRPEFYRAFNEAVRTGTKQGRIRVATPLIALRKSEIVTRGLELGAPFDLTWSCYRREDRACGTCDSCVLRLRAFAAAGAADPIPYLSPAAV